MNPWRTLAQEMEDDVEEGPTVRMPGQGENKYENSYNRVGQQQVGGWDINDPALELATFLESSDWKGQTWVPGADFVNLLRVLRPVDHAFFITLFVHQKPGRLATVQKEEKGASPKTSPTSTPEAAAAILKRKKCRACGPWIQDYVEFQNRVLYGTLPTRYTVHACSSEGSCADTFSQLIAMVSAFAWSVTESRAFFLRTDQLHLLQESFEPFLIPPWVQPPKAESVAKIDTEPLDTRELLRIFQLQDPLFLNEGTQKGGTAQDQRGGESQTVAADEGFLDRWMSWRSRSRNRGSFEKKLGRNDPAPLHFSGIYTKEYSRRATLSWKPESREEEETEEWDGPGLGRAYLGP